MIRKACMDDIGYIEDIYNEHFRYEQEHGAVTIFRKGVYPTRESAENAIKAGTMYVYESGHTILGSIIIDKNPPQEYKKVFWNCQSSGSDVMIIHLLMVRPDQRGRGIAASLIDYAVRYAQNNGCRAIRLDTGEQNIPAQNLYKKKGFQIVCRAEMKVGGKIPHSGHLFLEKILDDADNYGQIQQYT